MKLTTEYLVTVDKKSSEAFYALCDTSGGFNKLLQTDPDIIIKEKHIQYKTEKKFPYEIKTNIVKGKFQRFFHVKIDLNSEETDIDVYVSLLRSVKGIIHRAGGQPETLWDDVSLYYSHKSYPLIHKAESSMRKIITYFMITNVGVEWIAEASPNIVKEAIDKSKRKQYLDVLHQIDFIHLGDLLFKAYQTRDISKLYDLVSNAHKVDDLGIEELQGFIPKSNWERYFSKIVDCTDEYLDKRWKQLYDLRCMVAHNALVGQNEHDRITQLVGEVEKPIQKAIDNIDKVVVPKEDREQVAESIASNLSVAYGEFIQRWKAFEHYLISASSGWGLFTDAKPTFKPPGIILQKLQEKEIIDDELYAEGMEIVQFRNRLVHEANTSSSEQETHGYILRLDQFLMALKGNWRTIITSTLIALGGQASLTDIYKYIENSSHRELPKTWKATVRYTLQLNSSDTETSKRGGEDVFCHLEKGLWGLKDATLTNKSGSATPPIAAAMQPKEQQAVRPTQIKR